MNDNDATTCDFCDDPIEPAEALHDPAELEWLPAAHARAWCDAECYVSAHTDLHAA